MLGLQDRLAIEICLPHNLEECSDSEKKTKAFAFALASRTGNRTIQIREAGSSGGGHHPRTRGRAGKSPAGPRVVVDELWAEVGRLGVCTQLCAYPLLGLGKPCCPP